MASSAHPPTHAPKTRRSLGARSETHSNAPLLLTAVDSAALTLIRNSSGRNSQLISSREQAACIGDAGLKPEPLKHLMCSADRSRHDGYAAFLFDNRNSGQGWHLHAGRKD